MKGISTKKIAACFMAALCVTSFGISPVGAAQLNQDSKAIAVEATANESGKVVLYEHADYLGVSVALDLGRHTNEDFSLLTGKLSSVKVPEGYIVTLYENSDFTGNKKILTQDTVFLTDFNDITSSVVVSEDKITLFKDSRYSGESVKLGVGRYTFQDFANIGDDAVTSIIVPEGLKVTLYENSDFTGIQKVITENTDYNHADFNDKTSAVEITLNE